MDKPLFLLNQPRIIPIARIKLVTGASVIGRSGNCDLYLPHLSISRRHAEIHVMNKDIMVRDLDSRNGTFVDDDRVSSARVVPGQSLRFGDVSFLLTDGRACADLQDIDLETAGPGGDLNPADTVSEIAELSAKQRRVLELILEGLGEKQVAMRLFVSQHTVHNHVREIYRVLQVHSRLELFARLRPRPGDARA